MISIQLPIYLVVSRAEYYDEFIFRVEDHRTYPR
jgi:hypothetical protein